MNPDALAVLIPVVAIGGFFAWMIARTVSNMYTAKLQAQHQGALSGGSAEDVLAALDELRRQVAELAERVDFTERLLAKQRDGERLAPPGQPRG